MAWTMQTENNDLALNLNMRMGVGPLVEELKRQMESRVDVIADSRHMEVIVRDGRFYLAANPGTPLTEWMDAGSEGGMPIAPHAVGQLLEKCDVSIPKTFAEKLALAHPEWAAELATNLLRASAQTRLVRMLDGKVRAFLSNSYRCLDNFDLAATALSVARDSGAEVLECHLTPSRMEIKLVNRAVWDKIDAAQRGGDGGYGSIANHKWIGHVGAGWQGEDLPGGKDTVHPLVTVGNSETGEGGYYVRLGILQAVCCNSAIIRKELGQVHLGAKQTLQGILQFDTLRAEAKAIHLKARDIVKASFAQEKFAEMCGLMKAAGSSEIKSPKPALDFCVESGLFSESQRDNVFAYFVRDYKQTALGLASAMTRLAQDTTDADVATELEENAGKVIAQHKKFAALAAV